MDYHPVVIAQTASAARDLAEYTEYEAAGVMLRVHFLMKDGEDVAVILNMLRGILPEVLQNGPAMILKRIIKGIEAERATS